MGGPWVTGEGILRKTSPCLFILRYSASSTILPLLPTLRGNSAGRSCLDTVLFPAAEFVSEQNLFFIVSLCHHSVENTMFLLTKAIPLAHSPRHSQCNWVRTAQSFVIILCVICYVLCALHLVCVDSKEDSFYHRRTKPCFPFKGSAETSI